MLQFKQFIANTLCIKQIALSQYQITVTEKAGWWAQTVGFGDCVAVANF